MGSPVALANCSAPPLGGAAWEESTKDRPDDAGAGARACGARGQSRSTQHVEVRTRTEPGQPEQPRCGTPTFGQEPLPPKAGDTSRPESHNRRRKARRSHTHTVMHEVIDQGLGATPLAILRSPRRNQRQCGAAPGWQPRPATIVARQRCPTPDLICWSAPLVQRTPSRVPSRRLGRRALLLAAGHRSRIRGLKRHRPPQPHPRSGPGQPPAPAEAEARSRVGCGVGGEKARPPRPRR